MNLSHLHQLACAVCLPDQSSEVAKASNTAILFMVIVVFGMFGLIVKIMFNFARKQREFEKSSL